MEKVKAKRGRPVLYDEPSVKRLVVLPENLTLAIEKSGSLSLYLAKAAEAKAKRDKLI